MCSLVVACDDGLRPIGRDVHESGGVGSRGFSLDATPVLHVLGGHAMATLNGNVVLFGGNDSANPSPPGTATVMDTGFLDETWVSDGTTWTRRRPAQRPSARGYHAMATLGSKVVLFGGLVGANALADTWEWDGSSWTQRPRDEPARARVPRDGDARREGQPVRWSGWRTAPATRGNGTGRIGPSSPRRPTRARWSARRWRPWGTSWCCSAVAPRPVRGRRQTRGSGTGAHGRRGRPRSARPRARCTRWRRSATRSFSPAATRAPGSVPTTRTRGSGTEKPGPNGRRRRVR